MKGLVAAIVTGLWALPLAAAFDVPAHPIDIILGRPTDRSITVSVMPYQNGDGYLEAGPVGESMTATPERTLVAEQAVEFVLSGLRPDTPYSYRLFWRDGTSETYTATTTKTFRTARPPGSPFTFTIHADSHLDSNTSPALFARTMANVVADSPDFHFDLGDTFMTDKYRVFTDARPQYFAQRYYLGLAAASAPLFFTLGNHDGEQGSAADGTANNIAVWSARLRIQMLPNPTPDNFYSGNGTPEPNVGLLGNYFAFTWGDALFVVLDPFWPTRQKGNGTDNWNWTLGTEQYEWLRRTLESSPSKLKFVCIHHLVGGFGKDRRGGVEAAGLWEWGGANADGSPGFAAHRPGWAEPIHRLLVRTGVSAVFHGHDHLFVKQELDGIVYQEVPQPGFPRPDSVASAAEYGYTTGTLLGSSGHMRIRVAGGKATIDYVRGLLPADETSTRHNRDVVYSYTVTGKETTPPAPAAAWILPSSAHLPGFGDAFWTTDLTVANSGNSEASFTLKFLGHGIDGQAGLEKSFTLGAGKSVTYSDILGSLFDATESYGALRITATSPSLTISSQTWTPAPGGGTFGQSAPAFGDSDLIRPGAPRSIIGVREDASFRTNLVLANATGSPVDVDVAMTGESGNPLAAKRYSLAPLEMIQATRIARELGVTADVKGARLTLSTPTAGGAFAAYAALIDAVTSDPKTLLPR